MVETASEPQQQSHSKKSEKGERATSNQLVTALTSRCVKRIIEVASAATLKNESFYMQVLSLKEFDTNEKEAKKCVKLRF